MSLSAPVKAWKTYLLQVAGSRVNADYVKECFISLAWIGLLPQVLKTIYYSAFSYKLDNDTFWDSQSDFLSFFFLFVHHAVNPSVILHLVSSFLLLRYLLINVDKLIC